MRRSRNRGRRPGLWTLREGLPEILARLDPCAAFDVSVPMQRMEALVDRVCTDLEAAFPGRRAEGLRPTSVPAACSGSRKRPRGHA